MAIADELDDLAEGFRKVLGPYRAVLDVRREFSLLRAADAAASTVGTSPTPPAGPTGTVSSRGGGEGGGGRGTFRSDRTSLRDAGGREVTEEWAKLHCDLVAIPSAAGAPVRYYDCRAALDLDPFGRFGLFPIDPVPVGGSPPVSSGSGSPTAAAGGSSSGAGSRAAGVAGPAADDITRPIVRAVADLRDALLQEARQKPTGLTARLRGMS